eukprot:480522-Hanusia_phi.AAC.2
MIRSLMNREAKGPVWRAPYAYLMASKCYLSTYVNDSVKVDAMRGKDERGRHMLESTVVIEGFLRSRPLSADQLVHISGVGTFKVHSISSTSSGRELICKRNFTATERLGDQESRPEEEQGDEMQGDLTSQDDNDDDEVDDDEEFPAHKKLRKPEYFQDWEAAALDELSDASQVGDQKAGSEMAEDEGKREEPSNQTTIEEQLQDIKTKRHIASMFGGTEQRKIHPQTASFLDQREVSSPLQMFANLRSLSAVQQDSLSLPRNVAVDQQYAELSSNRGSKSERRLRSQLRGDEWEFLQGLEGLGESIDMEAEKAEYMKLRREVEDQILFPDEIDTPLNVTVVDVRVETRSSPFPPPIAPAFPDRLQRPPVSVCFRLHSQGSTSLSNFLEFLKSRRENTRRGGWEGRGGEEEEKKGEEERKRGVRALRRNQVDLIFRLHLEEKPVLLSSVLRHENKR